MSVGGSEILGPAGLWYGTVITTQEFLNKNREACLRSVAAMYRMIKLFDSNPQKVAQIGASALSRMTGGDFSVKEYINMETVYDQLLSVEAAKDGYFNKSSRLYWARPVAYYIDMAVKQGDLDKPVPPQDYYGQAEQLFGEIRTRQDLMSKINAPLNY